MSVAAPVVITAPAPSSIHERVEAERKAALPEADLLKRFRDYSRGRQRSTLTAKQERILRGVLGNIFCDNVCKQVIQAPANRLQLARFEVATEVQSVQDAILDVIGDVWTFNRLPALSANVHWATLRDGNHAVALRWARDRVRLVREPWWNGETGIFVAYDDDDMPSYAVKDWQDGKTGRRTIWWPDRIERYERRGEGWRMVNLPGDPVPDGRPVPWVDGRGTPLGIPVVHFPNALLPNDAAGDAKAPEPDSRYGMSELDGGTLGLQDEVNDLHRDISAAARYTGYQMLWAAGVTGVPDPEKPGEMMPYPVEPGAFFQDSNDAARFGTIPAGDLSQLERALGIKLRAISRATDTPMHLITGDWPSGVALLRAEMGLIEKVKKLGQTTGPAWASVMHKATMLANAFGRLQLDTDVPISTVFVAPEQSDPLTLTEIAERQAPYVSVEETLRTLGKQPADIERIMGERAEAVKERAAEPARAPIEQAADKEG